MRIPPILRPTAYIRIRLRTSTLTRTTTTGATTRRTPPFRHRLPSCSIRAHPRGSGARCVVLGSVDSSRSSSAPHATRLACSQGWATSTCPCVSRGRQGWRLSRSRPSPPAGAQASAVRQKHPGTERSQPPPRECVGGSAEDPRLVTIRTGLVLVVAFCDKGLFGFRVVEGLAACS